MPPEAVWNVFLSAHGNAPVPSRHARPTSPDELEEPPAEGGAPPWAVGRQELVAPLHMRDPWVSHRSSESIDPVLPDNPACAEKRAAVFSDDVRDLRDRCQIDLGRHYALSKIHPAAPDAVATLPAGYEPITDKSEMWADFAPDYWRANRVAWSDLRANIKADYQSRVAGLFWDDEHGYMNWAVVHALQLIANTTLKDLLGDEKEELFEACREAVRGGDLPLYLSPLGSTSDSLLRVTDQGEVSATDPTEVGWKGIALLEISLSPYYRSSAALADYLLWWGWRCHSYWKESGSEYHWYVGQSCVRLALAECARIGGTIVHEFVHTQGYWPTHCRGSSPDATAEWLAVGHAAGLVATAPWTWFGGAVVQFLVSAANVEPYTCVHNTLQHVYTGRACTRFNLPLPLTFLSTNTNEAQAAALAASGVSATDSAWDGVFASLWATGAYDPVDGTTLSTSQVGGWAWYEAIWGFAATPQGSGCDAATYTIGVVYDINGTTGTISWNIPPLCSNSGTNETRSKTL